MPRISEARVSHFINRPGKLDAAAFATAAGILRILGF
jgi:hypothetical protein